MSITYDKLWKLLIDKGMNKTDLKDAAGISFNVLARMGKNEPISFESLEKICATLECNIGDIIEIEKTKAVEQKKSDYTTIELFAGAGGLALGVENAGFDAIGLIEFDKDAANTLKLNRPNWRVIHDDVANISCLDLVVHHVRRFLMQENVWVWKMQEELCSIIMQFFLKNYSPKCFCLKMSGGY